MGKIQPFKALGKAVGSVAPLAKFIPGLPGWAGPAAGLLGGMLSGGGGKGGGGGGGGAYSNEQAALLAQVLPLLKDPGIAVDQYSRDAYGRANMEGSALGGLIADQTGQPGAEAAVMLGARNRATESVNRFGMDAYSPATRARTAMSLLPGYQSLADQSMRRWQLGKEYEQPTFWETLFNTASANVPWIIDLIDKNKKKNKGQSQSVGNDGSGGGPLPNSIGFRR